jgi:hypothetical protein
MTRSTRRAAVPSKPSRVGPLEPAVEPRLLRLLAQDGDQLVLAPGGAALDGQLTGTRPELLDAALLVDAPVGPALLLGWLALGPGTRTGLRLGSPLAAALQLALDLVSALDDCGLGGLYGLGGEGLLGDVERAINGTGNVDGRTGSPKLRVSRWPMSVQARTTSRTAVRPSRTALRSEVWGSLSHRVAVGTTLPLSRSSLAAQSLVGIRLIQQARELSAARSSIAPQA